MSQWAPLAGTARQIALEVLLNGPLSRSELARRLDLSAASLTRLTKPLLDSGLLTEGSASRGTGIGRPTFPLDVTPGVYHFVGVKLTDDSAYGVLTDIRSRVLVSDVRPLPSQDPGDVLDLVVQMVARLQSQAGRRADAIGVTLGGNIGRDGHVVDAHFLHWRDVRFGPMLAERTGIDVVVANDIVGWTEAEHWFGAGRGCDEFALVTIGAGVGLGLVAHRRVVGAHAMGLGLVSHIPLDPFGPPCHLGHRGCSTAMLTSGAIRATVSAGLGRLVSYDQSLDLAAAGDPVAAMVVEASGRALGRMVALVANITTVPRVIVSGEGARLAEVAGRELHEAVAADRPASADPLDISLDFAGFVEWARGAAVVAIQRFVLGGQ